MASNLRRRSPVTLLLLVVDLERHVEHLLVLTLVGLEPVQLVAEVLLFIQQLLQSIRQNYVCVVQTTILFVEMVVVVDDLLLRVRRVRQHVVLLLLGALVGASLRVKPLISRNSRLILVLMMHGLRFRRRQPELALLVVTVSGALLRHILTLVTLKALDRAELGGGHGTDLQRALIVAVKA